ncbi:hypothetical protein [Paenibacillus sp. GCM10027626]|uniref:hypothetical protein n=1 Tax=Paenibacillus sp. GCM10027626 TaxID=3273411 RepID=UPI003645D7E0
MPFRLPLAMALGFGKRGPSSPERTGHERTVDPLSVNKCAQRLVRGPWFRY